MDEPESRSAGAETQSGSDEYRADENQADKYRADDRSGGGRAPTPSARHKAETRSDQAMVQSRRSGSGAGIETQDEDGTGVRAGDGVGVHAEDGVRVRVGHAVGVRAEDGVEVPGEDGVEFRAENGVEVRAEDGVEVRARDSAEVRARDGVGMGAGTEDGAGTDGAGTAGVAEDRAGMRADPLLNTAATRTPPRGSPLPSLPTPPREYRTTELAAAAGITVRTLRFYRERKLLPPPRREGRIAWYDDHHLSRLRTISALLERGHTLNGIAELAEAFEHGRDVADVLGLGAPSEETPVHLSPEELADHFAGEVTPENLATALDLGYLAVDGDEIVHISRRLLDVSATLVREGVPLATVLEAGRQVRVHAEALADLFLETLRPHTPPSDPSKLRPLAKAVVEAELSMALDRRLSPLLSPLLRENAAQDMSPADDAPEAPKPE